MRGLLAEALRLMGGCGYMKGTTLATSEVECPSEVPEDQLVFDKIFTSDPLSGPITLDYSARLVLNLHLAPEPPGVGACFLHYHGHYKFAMHLEPGEASRLINLKAVEELEYIKGAVHRYPTVTIDPALGPYEASPGAPVMYLDLQWDLGWFEGVLARSLPSDLLRSGAVFTARDWSSFHQAPTGATAPTSCITMSVSPLDKLFLKIPPDELEALGEGGLKEVIGQIKNNTGSYVPMVNKLFGEDLVGELFHSHRV